MIISRINVPRPNDSQGGSGLLARSLLVLLAFALGGATGSAQSPEPESDSRLGPVLPEDIGLISPEWATSRHLRFFGWANGAYTGSSTGEGLLAVEPRANRFGDTWLVNQAAFVAEQTLDPEGWAWGFRAEFYGRSCALCLRMICQS
jgi:hypothetical protein